MPELDDLAISGLAHDGRGVARTPHGVVVFVAHALPGAVVRARVLRRTATFWEAEAVATRQPAPDTVPPLCPHHGQCGGCPLQSLSTAAQLRWKRTLVLDALSRLGGLDRSLVEARLGPVQPSPTMRHSRNKMEFAFGTSADSTLTLGLRRAHDHAVVPVPHCIHLPPEALAVVAAVRELAAASAFPAYAPPGQGPNRRPDEGFWRFCTLRRGIREDQRTPGWWVSVYTSPATRQQRACVQTLGRSLVSRFPQVAAFLHEERHRHDALPLSERRVCTLDAHGALRPEAARLWLPLGGHLFAVDAASFFQVNTAAAQSLLRTALALLPAPTGPPSTLLDLYCGVGVPGLLLAPAYGRVLGLEYDRRAVRQARENARTLALPQCRYTAGDVATLLRQPTRQREDVPRATDVLLDPPRAGAGSQVLTALQALAPERILYISCNPATLARDARILQNTHTLTALAAVDMFPHTPHVECLSLWQRLPGHI